MNTPLRKPTHSRPLPRPLQKKTVTSEKKGKKPFKQKIGKDGKPIRRKRRKYDTPYKPYVMGVDWQPVYRPPARVCTILDVARFFMYYRNGDDEPITEPMTEKKLCLILALLNVRYMRKKVNHFLFMPTEWKIEKGALIYKDLREQVFYNKNFITSYKQVFPRLLPVEHEEPYIETPLCKNRKAHIKAMAIWIRHLTGAEIAKELNKYMKWFARTQMDDAFRERMKNQRLDWQVKSMPRMPDAEKIRLFGLRARVHTEDGKVALAKIREDHRQRLLLAHGKGKQQRPEAADAGDATARNPSTERSAEVRDGGDAVRDQDGAKSTRRVRKADPDARARGGLCDVERSSGEGMG